MGVWVAVLNISPRTAAKIRDRHRLDPEDVRKAVVCVAGLRGTWSVHPERGRRLLIKVPVAGSAALVVLYPRPSSPDEWNLGSAYRIT